MEIVPAVARIGVMALDLFMQMLRVTDRSDELAEDLPAMADVVPRVLGPGRRQRVLQGFLHLMCQRHDPLAIPRRAMARPIEEAQPEHRARGPIDQVSDVMPGMQGTE